MQIFADSDRACCAIGFPGQVLFTSPAVVAVYVLADEITHGTVVVVISDKRIHPGITRGTGISGADGIDDDEIRQVKASPGDGTGITSSVIRQIWSDARGDIVCRTDNGVFMLDMRNYKLRDVAAASVRSSRQTSAALTDREGNQWSIGRYGVTKTSPVHHPATIVSGTEGVQARAFMTDDTGHWWLATKEDKCIRVYDGSNTLMGYLGSDGRMLRNTVTPDGYQVGADGAWIQGNSTSQSGTSEVRLNYAMAEAGLSKHSYYKNLSASQIAEAEAVAQEIAKTVLSEPSLKTDLDKVSAAGWLIYYNFILPGNYGNDANKYYRSPYGVFITGNNTCAGGTRALGRVLDYMGYEWSHANENQWTHQWCVLMMDGQQGYGDSMGFGSGYGTHPYAR